MKPKEFFSTLKEVFRKPKYLALAVVIAFLFYLLNVIITNYQNLGAIYSLNGFKGVVSLMPAFFFGLNNLLTTGSFVTLILISLIIGIFFSLIVYRIKGIKELSGKGGFITSSGIFLGVLAPGCAACSLGFLPLLGISSTAITFLPFQGLEISILAIGILSFSTFKITKEINKGILCEIPKND